MFNKRNKSKSNLSNMGKWGLNNSVIQSHPRNLNIRNNLSINMDNYKINEKKPFFYPLDKRRNFKSQEQKYHLPGNGLQNEYPVYSESFKSRMIKGELSKIKDRENRFNKTNIEKNDNKFIKKVTDVQNKYKSTELNRFLKLYKSQDKDTGNSHHNNILNCDNFIYKIKNESEAANDKFDSVKNTLYFPDPKSTYFQENNETYVRKDEDKFFDEMKVEKWKEYLKQKDRRSAIINRENMMIDKIKFDYVEYKKTLINKRKNNKIRGKI